MDLKCLSVVLPKDIDELIQQGCFEKASLLVKDRLVETNDPLLRDRLEFALLQMDQIVKDYPLSKEMAFEKCAMIDGFTMEEMDRLIQTNHIDARLIEGKMMFRHNIVNGIVKCAPGYAHRCPSMCMDQDLTDMIMTMINDGVDHKRFTVRQWVDLYRVDQPVSIWFPLPLLNDGQTNLSIGHTTLPIVSIGNGFGNNCHALVQTNDHTFDRVELSYSIEIHRFYGSTADNGEYGQNDLNECPPQIVFKEPLNGLVHALCGSITSDLVKSRIIYDYITTHFTYQFQPSYITIDSLLDKMLSTHKGDCGMYALLMVTMCRIAGIPARFESGIYVYPDGWTIHDWMAYYIQGKGWIHCDPQMGSEAYMHGRTMEHAFFYDHIDAYHIIYNHSFMDDFKPSVPCLRIDPYDNQLPEVQSQFASLDSTIVPRGFSIDTMV